MRALKLLLLLLFVGCPGRQIPAPDVTEDLQRRDQWVRIDLNDLQDEKARELPGTGEDLKGQEDGLEILGEIQEFEEPDSFQDKDVSSDLTYEGVYAGLEDLSGEQLRRALERITSSNYHSLSYHGASHQLMHYVDNYHGEVLGVYTGESYPPDQAEDRFNVEHTWPQSKGARSEPAKSDLYHLYPTNPRANSSRGNFPFGKVVHVDKTFGDPDCTDHFPGHPEGCLSYVGTDRFGKRVFEPRDAHKGNAARAVFYFAIRYHHSLTAFDSYGREHAKVTERILKEWNQLDPPDDRERTRNRRIHDLQRNYNPFIDHPEFVNRIEFVY